MNGFPEKVLLATDGLENTALADRAAVDLAKKGDAKKSTSETRNYEAFAPWLSLSTSIVFLLIAVQHANWGNVWCVSATIPSVTGPVMAFLGKDNQVPQVEEG